MFAASGAAAKLLSPDLTTFSLVFWRNLISFACVLLWFALFGFPTLRSEKLHLHIARGVASYLAFLTYFYAISAIPLANAVLLQSTSPIFIPILALLVLRRLSDRNVWIGVVIGFLGVALVLKPAEMTVSIGEAAGLAAGALGGVAALVIWCMAETESAQRQMFYFTLFTLACSIVMLPWTWQMPTLNQILPLLAVGIFSTLAQLFFALGCTVAPADKVVTWSYTSVIFAGLIGFLTWNERIDFVAALGMGLVVIGGRWASHIRRQRPATCEL
ncbi:MAG: DMT family transporter [Rhizobiaceae bacterium]|nr:DMT family transporter [Rhizobiaceae bacterium]